jgi:hypothetical protein
VTLARFDAAGDEGPHLVIRSDRCRRL